jgi:hypothetical protein
MAVLGVHDAHMAWEGEVFRTGKRNTTKWTHSQDPTHLHPRGQKALIYA